MTTSKTVADSLVKNAGYNSEKIVAYTPAQSGVVVHSWFNPKTGHYFTTDNSAAQVARLTKLGYTQTYQSNLYSASTSDYNAIPVNGSYNKAANHFYTTALTVPAGYGNSSVAFYGLAGNATINVPVSSKSVTAGTTTTELVNDIFGGTNGNKPQSFNFSTDGSGTAITSASSFTVTGYNPNQVGAQTVTLTVGGATNAEATATVTVNVDMPTANTVTAGAGFKSTVFDTTKAVTLGTTGSANIINGSTVDPYIGLTETTGFTNATANATTNTPSADISILNDVDSSAADVVGNNVLATNIAKGLVVATFDDQDKKLFDQTDFSKLDTTATGDVYTIHYYVANPNGTIKYTANGTTTMMSQVAQIALTVSGKATAALPAKLAYVDPTKDTVDTLTHTVTATEGGVTTTANNNVNTLTFGQQVLGATTFNPSSFLVNPTATTQTIAYVPAAAPTADGTYQGQVHGVANAAVVAQVKADAAAAEAKGQTLAAYYAATYKATATQTVAQVAGYSLVSSVDTTKAGTYVAEYETSVTTPGSTTVVTNPDGSQTITTTPAKTTVTNIGSISYNVVDAVAGIPTNSATTNFTATINYVNNGVTSTVVLNAPRVVLTAAATAADIVKYAPSLFTDANNIMGVVSNNTGTLTNLVTPNTPAAPAVNPYLNTTEAVVSKVQNLGAITDSALKNPDGTPVKYSNVQLVTYTYGGYNLTVALAVLA